MAVTRISGRAAPPKQVGVMPPSIPRRCGRLRPHQRGDRGERQRDRQMLERRVVAEEMSHVASQWRPLPHLVVERIRRDSSRVLEVRHEGW